MASHPKSAVESFNSEWQKAVGWAQSQGIGPSSYLPVYQMDLNRIQNGEYPMGAAERNLSILAAHNPRAVSSAPSDQPQSPYTPTGIMGNTVADAGKIFTGLGSIFTGGMEKQLWHSAQDTFDAVLDPARMEGPQLGTTLGNWLTKSLLAYVPGMYDIGTVLEHDPTLTGSSGLKALAEHPLISVLDLAGADSMGAGALGKLASGEGILGKIGAGSEMAKQYRGWARSDGSLFQQLANAAPQGKLAGATLGKLGVGKPNVNMANQPVEAMSISEVMAKLAAKAPGVGRAIGDAMQAYSTAGGMQYDNAHWIAEPANRAWTQLNETQKSQVSEILSMRGQTEGDSVLKALAAPPEEVDPLVKDALHAILEGPLRYSTEDSIFSGANRPTLDGNGRTSTWVAKSKQFLRINSARVARDATHEAAIKGITELAPFVEKKAQLDAMFPRALQVLEEKVKAARRAVAESPIRGRITREKAKATRFRAAEGLDKNRQVVSVLGEGGLLDEFKEQAAKNKDPDQVITLVKQMRGRLSKWNLGSIDAAELREVYPEIGALYDTLTAFEEWANQSKSTSAEIDRAIHGELETQSAHRDQEIQNRDDQVRQLTDSHRRQTADLRRIHDARIAELTNRFNITSKAISDSLALAQDRMTTAGDIETARMTDRQVNEVVWPRIQRELHALRIKAREDRYHARKLYEEQLRSAKLEKKVELGDLAKKQHKERVALGKKITDVKTGYGDLTATLADYGKAVDAYHQALADNVSDEYRDMFTMLYEKHLRIHENAAKLIAQTERFMKDKLGYAQDRIDEIRGNKDLLAEYMTAVFRGMFGQPDWTPEVGLMAQRAMREARDSAMEELKYAIAHKGLRIHYIPTAHAFDERLLRPSAFEPIIGKGIPKPDMEQMKLWDYTAKKDDFALGINGALVQTLQRKAVIDLTENYLSPMAMRPSDLAKFIATHFDVSGGLHGGNLSHEMDVIATKNLELTAFNPTKLFGFSLPRWGDDKVMYLPTSVVRALQRMEKDRGAVMRIAGKSTKLFRYSILYLSPRYTAHVLFGGTVMLAMRSTPYAPTFIGEAWRGIRDGTLPGAASHNAEEGFEDVAMRLHNEAGGRSQGVNVMRENIEQVQKVPLAKANPIHWLRAAADINVRFTRYVRDMQFAVAMLDGAAKAERRAKKIPVEDETGQIIEMTPERAMKEGMHHAEQVYGNLNRMSPFERMVAQSIMPFYGWQRHILGYVFSFPIDHPWRALVLSQAAFQASQAVPAGYPLRIQFLYYLGSPDSQGNVQPVDMRSLDPFRDVANYASLTGFFESLNPALSAPLTMAYGSGASFGNATLYPNVTYNQFYGIETAGSQGGLLQGIENWVPQTGAAAAAIDAVSGVRSEWQTNRASAIKTMLEDLNVPFVTPPINLKQVAAKDEDARFNVAKQAAYNAFQSGDFSSLKGYKTVPNPLNTAYEITPAQLQALYQQAQQTTPGVAPIESLLPPPTPYGW